LVDKARAFVISEKYGDDYYEEYAVNEISDVSEKRFPKGKILILTEILKLNLLELS